MTKKYRWLRHPKTTNEKRANQEGWCRSKRKPNLLADAWDDKPHAHQKSWKNLRKQQYRIYTRGQKHTLSVDYLHTNVYLLETYLRDSNIPVEIEPINKSFILTRTIFEKKVISTQPKYVIRYRWENKKLTPYRTHQIGYQNIVEYIPCGTKKYKGYRTMGYKLTWWSNKDIGIEYILNRFKI